MSVHLAAAASFVLCGLLARLLQRSRLADSAESASDRKLQRVPVPRVGGIALYAAACLVLPAQMRVPLLLALLAGAIDDLVPGGLGPAAKLLVQSGCALAIHALVPGAAWWLAPALVLCFNIVNTFDNSDGALGSLVAGGAALAGVRELAWTAAGFLPWNTLLRRDASAPTAYWGDSGSHLLAAWIVLDARLWPVLLLPLLDLAWVCVLRLRAGVAPWKGDRRHLAQALERRGLGLAARLFVLLGIGLPVLLLPVLPGLFAGLCAYIAGRILARERGVPDNPAPPIP